MTINNKNMPRNNQIDILSLLLGVIPYFSYVIIRDLGLDVEAISYLIMACLSFVGARSRFDLKLLKIEFLAYLLIVILVQTIVYGPLFKTFIKGLLVLVSSMLCANYMCQDLGRRVNSFLKGMIVCIFICEFYIFAFAKFRDMQFEGMRRTLEYFSASQVALASTVSILWSFAKWQSKRKVSYLVIALVAVASVVASFSKSGMIAPFVVILIFLLFNSQKHRIRNLLAMLVLMLLVFIVFNSAFQEVWVYILEENESQEDFQFNGRLPIWMVAYDYFIEHPWFGNGYYHSQELLEKFTYNNATQAHSMYYQVIMTVGVVGAACLLIYYIRILYYQRKLIKAYHKDWMIIWFHGMCLYFLIRGVTEGSIAQCASLDSFLFVLISMCTIRYYKVIK